MTRIAHCSCGSLHAEATGVPAFVGACHHQLLRCRASEVRTPLWLTRLPALSCRNHLPARFRWGLAVRTFSRGVHRVGY